MTLAALCWLQIGKTTVPIVEATALRDSLLTALDLRFHDLLVEGDSSLVINCVNGKFKCPWRLIQLIQDIRSLASSFQSISFQHRSTPVPSHYTQFFLNPRRLGLGLQRRLTPILNRSFSASSSLVEANFINLLWSNNHGGGGRNAVEHECEVGGYLLTSAITVPTEEIWQPPDMAASKDIRISQFGYGFELRLVRLSLNLNPRELRFFN
ncbi:hypothetical protein ACLB2K_024903 [Fragaria x ananassa]